MSDQSQPIPNDLNKLLIGLDKTHEPTSPSNLVEQLAKLCKAENERGGGENFMLEAEWTAFAFYPRENDRIHDWGTYFGPSLIQRRENGTRLESPALARITQAHVEYWLKRMNVVTHPVLRARYADVSWDIGRKLFKDVVSVDAAQIAIDSYALIVSRKLEIYLHERMEILRRALNLALSIHDDDRIQLIVNTALSLEKEASEEDRVSVWFFWFDLLITETATLLSQPLKEQIIGNLEAVLKTGVDSIGSEKVQDPFVSKGAAERLANYYAGEKKPTEVKRVISLCIDHFLGLYETISSMQAHAWFEELLDFAAQYNFSEAVEKLSVILQQIGSKVHDDMHEHSFQMEIPKKEIDDWMDRMLSGSLEETIGKMAVSFIPNQKHLEKQVKDMAVQAPLAAFIKMHQFGEDGQPIAQIGSVEDDFSGRLVVQASQNMQIESNFLHEALNRLVAKIDRNPQIVVKEIEKSPLFNKSNLEIMERGIAAHFSGDYLVSVHLLIPQIESSFRNLLKLCQRPIWQKNRNGGMDTLLLDKLLRDPAVESVFGPDAVGYFKVLLTDRRGWNLRNRICHGLLSSASFGSGPSDRALHVIFLLAQLRRKSVKPET